MCIALHPLEETLGTPMKVETIFKPHVLVVDDEDDLCELISYRLEHHGFRVSAAHASQGALETLEREAIDAMILDLRLRNERGLDLLAEVRKRSRDLPVIVLTAHGSIETAVQAVQGGAYGFLTKPFDDHELLVKLHHAVERVRLRREVAGLRRLVQQPNDPPRLFGTSEAINSVREVISRIAPTDATVLLLGASGTGKEVAARSIHALSPRRDAAFVGINCGALPANLLESELFGHVRGAFTGALRNKEGLFAAAHGGTIFLDEIGDAPPGVQVKLLRVLQERVYHPVGSTEPRESNVRVLAATNRDLCADIAEGRFREDLFYRLHVVPISMPLLRHRHEDIPLLAELFLSRAAAVHMCPPPRLSREALQLLMGHSWPGNVRELANVMEGAALLTTDGVLHPEQLHAVIPAGQPMKSEGEGLFDSSPPLVSFSRDNPLPTLREAREAFEQAYIEEALRRTYGQVASAAKLAGRNRTDFYDLLKRHDLNASDFRKRK